MKWKEVARCRECGKIYTLNGAPDICKKCGARLYDHTALDLIFGLRSPVGVDKVVAKRTLTGWNVRADSS